MENEITLDFDRHNETKNKVRFKEDAGDHPDVVKWLYIDQEALSERLGDATELEVVIRKKG